MKVDEATLALLRAHREAQNAERMLNRKRWVDNRLVFPDTQGGLWNATNFERYFRGVRAEVGLRGRLPARRPRIRHHHRRPRRLRLRQWPGRAPRVQDAGRLSVDQATCLARRLDQRVRTRVVRSEDDFIDVTNWMGGGAA